MSRGKYVEFALIDPNLGGYGFSSYVNEEGDVKYIEKFKNEFGQPVKKHYEFTQSRRIIRVPASKTAEIEFLRNCPECEDSPNGFYIGEGNERKQVRAYFREINEGKDASSVVAATKDRVRAQNKALEISEDPDLLKKVATVCGCFKQDSGLQLSHILQYAEASPGFFMNIVEAPELEASYLVKSALKKGIMKSVGSAVKFGDLAFADEEDAISKVMTDKVVREGLKKQNSKY